MNRVTFTKKANGRYYVGLDQGDLIVVRESLREFRRQLNPGVIPKVCGALDRVNAALEKPARGES
jgi:hypothetical protein